jgi:hypothetical protein
VEVELTHEPPTAHALPDVIGMGNQKTGNSKSIVAFGTFEGLKAVDPVCAVQHKIRSDSLQTVFALRFSSKALCNRPAAQGLPSAGNFVIHNGSTHTQFSRTLNPSFAIFNDDLVMSI